MTKEKKNFTGLHSQLEQLNTSLGASHWVLVDQWSTEVLFWYSWGHLVVPYTEELISRPFLDENLIWRLFWDRVDPWPAAGCFFPALCHFCIGFHWIAKSHGAGTVFSGGFVSKTLRWISFQLYLLHFPKPILTSLIAAWICFQQWQCSCFYANMTGLPLSSLLYFHHH